MQKGEKKWQHALLRRSLSGPSPITRAKNAVAESGGFAAGLALSALSYPVHSAPSNGGDTVQGLYDALLNTMKNVRTLGQSWRFMQLAPVIDSTSIYPRWRGLTVGSSWAGLTEAQRLQANGSFGRYISAIHADRFDSYDGQKLEVTGEQPRAIGGDGTQSDHQSQR